MPVNQTYIIEDEKILGQQLQTLLNASGYETTVFQNAEEFIISFGQVKSPSIFLIDLGLPGLKGIELVKLIRFQDKISPIFVLSGSLEEKDVTASLDSGADDFISKPFKHEHLLLKLQNAQTRLQILLDKNSHHGIQLIPEGYLVIRDGIKVKLTRREFGILERLISQPETIHQREELTLINGSGDMTDRSIDVHVSSLRKKIKTLKLEIETSRGQGYKFCQI